MNGRSSLDSGLHSFVEDTVDEIVWGLEVSPSFFVNSIFNEGVLKDLYDSETRLTGGAFSKRS